MKRIFALLLVFHMALGAWAQVTITASTDKTELTANDQLLLTIQISGAIGEPTLPTLSAFNVYFVQQRQSIHNSQKMSVYQYVLTPRIRSGTAVIEPITFQYKGKKYQSAPIDIRIYRDEVPSAASPATSAGTAAGVSGPAVTAAPATGKHSFLEDKFASLAYEHRNQKFFIISAVNNPHPYVNESITLSVRFYYRDRVEDTGYFEPACSNAFIEATTQKSGSQEIDGKTYYYREQRYRIMGAAPGQAVIGAATLVYRPVVVTSTLFGTIETVGSPQEISTEPVRLTIEPLPSNRPDSFYGSVGTSSYTFQSTAEPRQVAVGEAIDWTATVSAVSPLKPTRDLTFPPVEGFKSNPVSPVLGQGATASLNTKTFKTVLIPSATGIYTLPALEWSYFNPISKKYHTLTTEPISITVVAAAQTPDLLDFSNAPAADKGIKSLHKDIFYVKDSYGPAPSLLARLSAWRFVNAVMLLLLGACVLFASFGKQSLAKKKIFLTAKNRLKKAKAYTEVAEAVSVYLHQKFNINTGSLPLKEIVACLIRAGVRPASAESFSLLWQRLEAARFAPDEPNNQSRMDLSSQALDVLTLMEEETK